MKALTVFVLFEGFLLGMHWVLNPMENSTRLFPSGYYPFVWALHTLLTILLWYILHGFKGKSILKLVVFNGIVFIAYFVVWVGIVKVFYVTAPSSPNAASSLQDIIYGSWPEIGRYLIKVVVFYALQHYFNFRQSANQRIELAVINKALQLKLLQEQLSPHFYFNTLNNLYGMALSGSNKLGNALSQLSNIMKYVTEDCNHEVVSLQSEIHFLQSYLALEKLRYETETFIEMKVEGIAAKQMIIPMLLIQFLENAFKHGLQDKAAEDWMKVWIEIREAELNFRVENSYNKITGSEGIGLQSVRKRLDIQYPGKHKMNISENGRSFSVQLKLELKNEAA